MKKSAEAAADFLSRKCIRNRLTAKSNLHFWMFPLGLPITDLNKGKRI